MSATHVPYTTMPPHNSGLHSMFNKPLPTPIGFSPCGPSEPPHSPLCSRSGGQMQDGQVPVHSHQFATLLIEREQQLCQLPARIAQGDGVISWADRDREAAWVVHAARRLGLDTDSVAAAVAILDRVVCSTRVPAKYLNCVAAACLHISKKLCEDHEETTTNFLRRLRLEYSASELKRMETRILTLLNWDVQLPTLSRFLDAMLSPLGSSYLVAPLRCHLEAVICCSPVMSEFRPSVVALSIVSLVLEATRRHWLHSSQHLIKTFKVDIGELIRCRERVSQLWERRLAVPSFSLFALLQPQDDDEMDTTEQMINDENNHSCSYRAPLATPGGISSASDLASPPALQPTPC